MQLNNIEYSNRETRKQKQCQGHSAI